MYGGTFDRERNEEGREAHIDGLLINRRSCSLPLP